MYSTQAYLYQQKNQIIITEVGQDFDTKRARIVYAKPLRISRGVDNNLLFEFQNQEQRPFDLTGSDLIFRVISRDGKVLLLEKPVTVLNAKSGRARVTVKMSELDNVEPQDANWTITRKSGVLTEPAYVDDHAGSRGNIEIRDGIFPDYVHTTEITMPSQSAFIGSDRASRFGLNSPPSDPMVQFSSWARGSDSEQSTLQISLKDFTGKIEIQGALESDDIWFGKTEYPWFKIDFSEADDNDNKKISELEFENSSETFAINIMGLFPRIRLTAEVSDGSIENILYR